MIPVVISTYPGREEWLTDLMTDFPTHWDVHVVHGWELDAIRYGFNLGSKRFLHLQDSWRIHRAGFVEAAIDRHKASIAFTNDPVLFGCYTGVFERDVLDKIEIPEVEDKADAIRLEIEWTSTYVEACPNTPAVLFKHVLHDWHGTVTERHGRTNLMISTPEVTKYKGTWQGRSIV
jgi:hypothetical protein